MRWIDEGFRKDPGHYVLQTLLAFAVIVVIAWVMLQLTSEIVTAALGATAFIVFAMPKHDTAGTRHVIGGHALCIGIGVLFSVLVRYESLTRVPQALFIALVVSLAIFAMVVTDTEYPPAAANALAFAIAPTNPLIALAALGVVGCFRSFGLPCETGFAIWSSSREPSRESDQRSRRPDGPGSPA